MTAPNLEPQINRWLEMRDYEIASDPHTTTIHLAHTGYKTSVRKINEEARIPN